MVFFGKKKTVVFYLFIILFCCTELELCFIKRTKLYIPIYYTRIFTCSSSTFSFGRWMDMVGYEYMPPINENEKLCFMGCSESFPFHLYSVNCSMMSKTSCHWQFAHLISCLPAMYTYLFFKWNLRGVEGRSGC